LYGADSREALKLVCLFVGDKVARFSDAAPSIAAALHWETDWIKVKNRTQPRRV